MRLFRLVKNKYSNQSMSGEFTRRFESQWFHAGVRAIYCCSSPSDAIKEIGPGLEENSDILSEMELSLISIDVPDFVSRQTIWKSDIPRQETGIVNDEKTRETGDQWLNASLTCMLVVPSRIDPNSHIYIINPLHRDFELLNVLPPEAAGKISFKEYSPNDKRRVFLCHASEDKDRIVRPVREELFKYGIGSWFDDAELTLGDSITSKINQGLGEAEYVIVFISPAFIRKPWPQKELNAALNREARTGKKVVIPIVIDYDSETVDFASFLPLAEDKLYGKWDGDAEALAEKIQRAVKQGDR
jgi:RES domain-containing protein